MWKRGPYKNRFTFEEGLALVSHLGADECWPWRGNIDSEGYGRVRVGDVRRKTHQVSYERFIGPIPAGLEPDHLCRNRACFNPRHLEAVPNSVNWIRGAAFTAANARKTHCARGHEFTPENTYIGRHRERDGDQRVCRECMRQHKRNFRKRRAAKQHSAPRESAAAP